MARAGRDDVEGLDPATPSPTAKPSMYLAHHGGKLWQRGNCFDRPKSERNGRRQAALKTLAANLEASTGIFNGRSKLSCPVATQNLMDERPSPKIRYPQNKTEPSTGCISEFLNKGEGVLEDGFTGKIFGFSKSRKLSFWRDGKNSPIDVLE
ncbi:hypothetical protein K438DRAFT_1781386 [Mycena galopus ATCC 62051]|nr:hypothetical protein K438DRAFT_1781386 [Mycena galopus ATCC 62051]